MNVKTKLFVVSLAFACIYLSFNTILTYATSDKLTIEILDDNGRTLRDVKVDVNDKDAKAIKQNSSQIVIRYVADDGNVEKKNFEELEDISPAMVILVVMFTIVVCFVLAILFATLLQHLYF